ncbi:hypothetical protein EC957_001227 [Mortierella hygrophila]|uniref:Uncharacterized protein n=1 Tax=Mortierella hygrophila TaxID=979708 RepID=A0A9P6K2K5_9FUNG|nr:hypothetical protein EC957_001227 [Mortierella hygrophila]
MAPTVSTRPVRLLKVRAISSLYSSTLTNGTAHIVFTAEMRTGHRFSVGINPSHSPMLNSRVRHLVERDLRGGFMNMELFLAGEAIVIKNANAEGEELVPHVQMTAWEVFLEHPFVEAGYTIPRIL